MEPLRRPGMLLIGSAARNSGKTELCCRIIRRFRSLHTLCAIKVSTLHTQPDSFVRNQKTSELVNEHFVITEEKDPGNAKDTGRLLAAGATRVFRLQTSRRYLHDGLTTLLQEFHKGQLIICESNSLRLVVQPDLFFMVHRTGWMFTKPSALEISHYVDRWVWSDSRTFDLDLAGLVIENGQWKLVRNAG